MARRSLQLNIGITETLARRSYRLFKHVFENTKKTENPRMIPELRKLAIKMKASSIRESDTDFCQLVEKLELAELARKLEETENLETMYVTTLK